MACAWSYGGLPRKRGGDFSMYAVCVPYGIDWEWKRYHCLRSGILDFFFLLLLVIVWMKEGFDSL